jgi:hypothetical protein
MKKVRQLVTDCAEKAQKSDESSPETPINTEVLGYV